MSWPPDSSRLEANHFRSVIALLGALAGAVGCAGAPTRMTTFQEAGLLHQEPGGGPGDWRPPADRPPMDPTDTGRPSVMWSSDPRQVAGRPSAAHPPSLPPVRDAAPEALPTEPPVGPPIDPALLRFAAEARTRRLRTAPGRGFPAGAEAAWRGLVTQLDGYLDRSLPQTPLLELIRTSVTLEAEWELDQRRYGPAPPALARRVTARATRLDRRIATSRALGSSLFAARPPGRLRWPVESAGLSSGFGPREHPLHGTPQLHAGIDLAADLGRLVSAATQGYVVSAGWAGGYGLLVELRHPGDLTTRYGHLSALLCAPGDELEAGAPLGLVGRTGLSTGPHLHFEVWEGGLPRDPLSFIGGGSDLALPVTPGLPRGGPR